MGNPPQELASTNPEGVAMQANGDSAKPATAGIRPATVDKYSSYFVQNTNPARRQLQIFEAIVDCQRIVRWNVSFSMRPNFSRVNLCLFPNHPLNRQQSAILTAKQPKSLTVS